MRECVRDSVRADSRATHLFAGCRKSRRSSGHVSEIGARGVLRGATPQKTARSAAGKREEAQVSGKVLQTHEHVIGLLRPSAQEESKFIFLHLY